MIVQILILLAGLCLVVFGADYLVEGSSSVARRFGLSEFVIGLTIVGMGTSAPEMVVSFIGAFEGKSDIAIGNVIGSNIFNTLLILGLTALVLPIAITPLNRRRDIPVNIAVTVLFLAIGFITGGISRIGGAVLLAVFAVYIYESFKSGNKDENSGSDAKPIKLHWAILMIVGGLAALVIGGRLFVDSATKIAQDLGVSDKFIAITILAGGTSMPELATCVMAAVKKKGQLALGNIIGSNLFNILLIMGGSALIHPLSFAAINYVDAGVLVLSSLVLLISCFIGRKNCVDRFDGAFFVLIWAGYMAWLVINL